MIQRLNRLGGKHWRDFSQAKNRGFAPAKCPGFLFVFK